MMLKKHPVPGKPGWFRCTFAAYPRALVGVPPQEALRFQTFDLDVPGPGVVLESIYGAKRVLDYQNIKLGTLVLSLPFAVAAEQVKHFRPQAPRDEETTMAWHLTVQLEELAHDGVVLVTDIDAKDGVRALPRSVDQCLSLYYYRRGRAAEDSKSEPANED